MREAPVRKILIVEDYEDTRLMMRLELEARGYRVVEAPDGEEAVRVAWRECPNIILMDLSLPKIDGFEAARRIREDEQMRDVLIVAVTAHQEPLYRANALETGLNAFVTKPIDFDWLDELLKSLVQGRD
ncbi:MAG TPA: response regulator [Pyrinomonadaceae bacterium]|nr:response regulator [Pyrinomonadaceae bacterium]